MDFKNLKYKTCNKPRSDWIPVVVHVFDPDGPRVFNLILVKWSYLLWLTKSKNSQAYEVISY